MALERFADVVERFTHGYGNGHTLEPRAETVTQWQEELESSGAESLSVLGYCMGAPLSASFLAAYPETPVKNFINMAGPIDFSKIGLFGLWLDEKYFNVDRFVETIGAVPADMVKAGLK